MIDAVAPWRAAGEGRQRTISDGGRQAVVVTRVMPAADEVCGNIRGIWADRDRRSEIKLLPTG